MSNVKFYKDKISSFNNIEKITRTMKLVSASKLRQAHHAESSAKNYAKELKALIARLAASVDSAAHPLLTPKETVRNVLLLVLTSDKGLCGSFNNFLCKKVQAWVAEQSDRFENIDLSFGGKRGYMYFRRNADVKNYYEEVTAKPDFAHAIRIGDDIIKHYVNNEYDEVYIAYNQFHNPISQTPHFEKMLPIKSGELMTGGEAFPSDYIFEPEKNELLRTLVPRYLYFRIHYALLENAAGEHGARMAAMENATQNAKNLIDEYTLLRNRARQAAITTELTEIVSGAESLKN